MREMLHHILPQPHMHMHHPLPRRDEIRLPPEKLPRVNTRTPRPGIGGGFILSQATTDHPTTIHNRPGTSSRSNTSFRSSTRPRISDHDTTRVSPSDATFTSPITISSFQRTTEPSPIPSSYPSTLPPKPDPSDTPTRTLYDYISFYGMSLKVIEKRYETPAHTRNKTEHTNVIFNQ